MIRIKYRDMPKSSNFKKEGDIFTKPMYIINYIWLILLS